MRIGIDGYFLCGKKTGMGTVVYHVLKNWKSTADFQMVLYLPQKLDEGYTKELLDNQIEIRLLGESNTLKWEQIIIPKKVKKDRIDVLWCPYNTAPIQVHCKVVVTINDVIYMGMHLRDTPSLYKKMGLIYRKTIVPFAARKASKIITISQYTESEIATYFPRLRHKIQVIYISADTSDNRLGKAETDQFFSRSGINKPYILGFGSLEKRKNSMTLIQAYEQLPEAIQKQYQLVLFGFRGYRDSAEYQYVQRKNLGNVVMLEYVSNEVKPALFAESKMFVFPTLSEGFGIPVLEAFANRTPVITSNVTSIPEVAGNAAILTDPNDKLALAKNILTLIQSDEYCGELVEQGTAQLQKFSWKTTADQILAVLLHANRRPY